MTVYVTDVQWCAGLFVGEGSSFVRCRANAVPQVVMSIGMLDEQAIRRFAACFDLPVEVLSYHRDRARKLYRTRATGIKAIETLVAMIPAMGLTDKAAQARATLAAGLVELRPDGSYTLLGRCASPEIRARMAAAQQARRHREKAGG